MQDEKERGTELDYCDLDPTKICDNCCKCIDSGKDYEDFHDLFDDDDEYSFDPHNVAPLDIDPKLMAEWEQKLRAAEIEDAQQKIQGLKGVRKKR